jgi:hypothetical protein
MQHSATLLLVQVLSMKESAILLVLMDILIYYIVKQRMSPHPHRQSLTSILMQQLQAQEIVIILHLTSFAISHVNMDIIPLQLV